MKIKIVFLLTLLIMVLSGCGNRTFINDFTNTETGSSTIDENENNNLPMLGNECSSSKGYYFIQHENFTVKDSNFYIYYYDYATRQCNKWCNKLECKHNDNTCTAYIPTDTKSKSFLKYQKGKIYLLEKTIDGTYLDSYNEDGSNQTRLLKLWDKNSASIDADTQGVQYLKIYNNKIYYAVNTDFQNISIYSCELEKNSSPQKLCELNYNSQQKTYITSLLLNDNNLYFYLKVTNQNLSETKTSDFLLYSYNLKTNQLDKVVNDSKVISYSVSDKGLFYYICGQGLYFYDNINDPKLVYNNQEYSGVYPLNVYCTDKYIILDNEMVSMFEKKDQKIIIFDYNYSKIDEIVTDVFNQLTGLDGLFMYFKASNNVRSIFNLKQIGSSDKGFTNIKVSI